MLILNLYYNNIITLYIHTIIFRISFFEYSVIFECGKSQSEQNINGIIINFLMMQYAVSKSEANDLLFMCYSNWMKVQKPTGTLF